MTKRTKAQAIAAARRHDAAMKRHFAERDAAITEAHQLGGTLREIAEGVPCSAEAVRMSIARHNAI